MSVRKFGIKKISKFNFLIKAILGIRVQQISVFCGWDISHYAGIGTWKKFSEKAINLTEEYIAKNRLKTKFEGDLLRRMLSDDFSTALKILNDCEAIVNKKLLLQLLSAHCSFELREGDEPLHYRHTAIHEYIAKMPVLSIWTTNVDQLLEEAFIEMKIDHVVVDRAANAAKHNYVFRQVKDGKVVPIFKYHGTCIRVHSSKDSPEVSHDVFLTGKDYRKSKPAFLSNHLDVAIKHSSMLFIGYDFPMQDMHVLECMGKHNDNGIRHLALMTKRQFQECKERIQSLNIDVCLISGLDEVGEILYMVNRFGSFFWR